MFICEKTHRYLKNDYQFFDALKTKDRKISVNCNLLTKVKFHESELSSPLSYYLPSRHNNLKFFRGFAQRTPLVLCHGTGLKLAVPPDSHLHCKPI